ncbi:ATP-dependent Clp protease adaptor protein ClpS [Cellulosimicrobium aquatile]|uniref:ATP-dependent Clp protease adapter protein ClpS n=1 Tax=Cellulosimicrobium aquatile TaxID=1612203 RepID=A0A1N6W0Z2_9MICO|nr:ATP-dependent Clp protease adapter ClpS [Cellulosimicrobium cellulans]NMF30616.1 ATP-dependent Clp protease adapter ClpS [Cellulosimicrobium aquatile]SIQ83807.1 ATP-dependent Clp protease adaptor protein ClpS [Cellulosimicrobium aquatile]
MRPHPIFTRPAAARASLTVPEEAVRTEEATRLDSPWVTLVWNDPVNLMSYVAYVFESYFGYSTARAHELMMQVHQEGRAVVSTGDRERMEVDVQAMHSFGLWATLQKDGEQ